MLQITNEDRWHEYAHGTRVKIRPLRRKDIRVLLGKAKGDDDRYNEMVADHVIQGWEGIAGHDGAPLPVTPENKLLVMEVPSLAAWINQHASAPVTVPEEAVKN